MGGFCPVTFDPRAIVPFYGKFLPCDVPTVRSCFVAIFCGGIGSETFGEFLTNQAFWLRLMTLQLPLLWEVLFMSRVVWPLIPGEFIWRLHRISIVIVCLLVIRKLSPMVEQFSPLHSRSRIVLIACTSRPVGVMNQWASSFVSWHIFPRFSICMQLDRLYLSFALWLLTWEVLVSFFWLKIPTLPTQFWGFIWLILYMRVHLGMVYGLNRTLKQNECCWLNCNCIRLVALVSKVPRKCYDTGFTDETLVKCSVGVFVKNCGR